MRTRACTVCPFSLSLFPYSSYTTGTGCTSCQCPSLSFVFIFRPGSDHPQFIKQGILYVSTETELDKYLSIMSHNEAFARGVTILIVKFHGRSPPIAKLHLLMSRTSNIDTLEIELPHVSILRCTRMLSLVHCPRLAVLRTKTISHQGLVNFLQRHPRLISLDVGLCGAAMECPMGGVLLISLSDIAGPAACVSSLILGNDVTRVTATHDTAHDVHSVPSLFTTITSSKHISILHLDFAPAHHEIMRLIIAAAPQVTSLKLTENGLECQVNMSFSRKTAQ